MLSPETSVSSCRPTSMWTPPIASQLPWVGNALNRHGQPYAQLQRMNSCPLMNQRAPVVDICSPPFKPIFGRVAIARDQATPKNLLLKRQRSMKIVMVAEECP